MAFSFNELIILIALVVATGVMLAQYRNVKNLRRDQQKFIEQTIKAAAALDRVHNGFQQTKDDLQGAADNLAHKIDEAKRLSLKIN